VDENDKVLGLTITAIDIQKGADDGTGFVYLDAVGADETPDIDGEIFDYKTSKPLVVNWSDDAAETTKASGQVVSYGNIRAQHGKDGSENAAGTICEPIFFDDPEKSIKLRIKVVDSDAITKVKEGVYRGISVKGALVGKKWPDGKYYRYTVKPTEFSLVDKPANPNATIQVIKADGSHEVWKVAGGAKTKRVGGKDLGPESFAYVGDKEETATWKLPIHDASHVRNALARLNQTQGIPEDKKAGVRSKIIRAAKRFDIDASSLDEKESSKSDGGFAGTGMSTVAQLAYLLDQLFYLRDTTLFEAEVEEDDSPIPKRLSELLNTAAEILEDMTSEEVKELIAMTETAKKSAESTEVEKAAKGGFEKAKSAHEKMGENIEEMGDHLTGKCKCAGIGKCAEKMAGLHEKIKAAHGSMGDHFKGDGAKGEPDGDEEKAAKEKETEEEKKAREKKEAADKEKEKSAIGDQIKALSDQVAALTEIVSKAAEGKGFTRPVPMRPGASVVNKGGDQNEEKDVVEKRSEIKADDPRRVDKLYQIDRSFETELVKL
jgi:hypothetical protein